MTLLILSILVLGLLAYLLLMPLELCLDSYRQRYYLRLGALARVSVEKDPIELLRLHLKVLFMNFFWRPSDLQGRKRGRKKAKPQKAGGKSRKISLVQARNLLGTFRVKAFHMELDSGNPVLNARLFPLAFLLRQLGRDVEINFLGRNQILLQLTNRPVYILNTFINLKK